MLVVAGTGAALAGFAPSLARRRAAAAFLAVGLVATVVFAAGRFGADVGAAIVFPVGAAVAAVVVAGGRRRSLLWVVVAPFAVLALLAAVDLVSGANAHLTRSVLDAGGLGDLADVAQRRLQLSAHSFARPVLLFFLPVVVAVAVLAYLRRARLGAWLAGAAGGAGGPARGRWRRPWSAPSPTTPAPSCSRSEPLICWFSRASPGPRRAPRPPPRSGPGDHLPLVTCV